MTVNQTTLGSFGDLATALGLLSANGEPNPAWFTNPVNGGDDDHGNGLRSIMADAGQRAALERFVDEVLGSPQAHDVGAERWIPLFVHDVPNVTVFAVIEQTPGETRLGIGVEHTTARLDPPRVTTRLSVPVFRFAPRNTQLASDPAGPPSWLLLGRAGGTVRIGVDVALRSAPAPAGEAALGGVAADLLIPTDGRHVGFALTLRDLQLPGAPVPRTFGLDLDSPDEFRNDVLELLVALVRAQADALDLSDPVLARFAALAGLLGLRDPGVTPFPVEQLPARGAAAIVDWIETVLANDGVVWLGELARLLGGTAHPARQAVRVDLGPVALWVGVRVTPGAGDHSVLVPWVELALNTRTGASARAAVDLASVDTGTGSCTAVPGLCLEGVFGADAGGAALVTGTDPHVGSVHLGIALDRQQQPAFVLTAHDVKAGSFERDVCDLSSPQAALDTAASALRTAVDNALSALGQAGDLVAVLIGTQPPTVVPSVTKVRIPELLADPVAEVRRYWADLVAHPTALGEVLGHLGQLVSGLDVEPPPGAGTRDEPWSIELLEPLSLDVWRLDGIISFDLALSHELPVLGDLTSTNAIRFTAAAVDVQHGTVSLACGAVASTTLSRTDGGTTRLVGPSGGLVFDMLGVEAVWRPAAGLRPQLTATALGIELGSAGPTANAGMVLPVPLPQVDDDGHFTFQAADWAAIEAAIAALATVVGVPAVDAAIGLLGWSGRGPHLNLEDLVTGDPVAALENWAADLMLDCDRVRTALGPVAALLSGFSVSEPLGSGNAQDPFRCPVAGVRRAPGLSAWVDPGCAVASPPRVDLEPLLGGESPSAETVAAVLRAAGDGAADVADLMVGRGRLGEGLQVLLDWWENTDGGVLRPDSVPVPATTIPGRGYAELVALGSTGNLAGLVLEGAATTVVHVCSDPGWASARAAGHGLDLTGDSLPAAPSAPQSGEYFVRVPSAPDAAAARPDRGGVAEQAARLTDLLSGFASDFALIGYGDAGAAVVRAARVLPRASRVVTVGTPWGSVAADALRMGQGGDALRLLKLLDVAETSIWPDDLVAFECTPLLRLQKTLERTRAALAGAAALPSAAAETRSDKPHQAVFGSIDAEDLARGLGAFVARGLQTRVDAQVRPSPGTATAVHVGVGMPVLDLTLGGLLVGAGGTLELCRLAHPATGSGLDATFARALSVDLHLGVDGGWLVGGPGSTTGADVRWMSVRVDVPLEGTEGSCELVLHEARALGVERERWLVRAGDSPALPEVRLLLGEVLERLRLSSPDVAALLTALGMFEPDGLDRLMHDTAQLLRGRVAVASTEIATALRALVPAATGTGAVLGWTVGSATLTADLAAGTLGIDVATTGEVGVTLHATASPTWAQASVAVGVLEERVGGIRLVMATPAAPGGRLSAAVELGTGSAAPSVTPLWPAPDAPGLTRLAGLVVPALGIRALLQGLLVVVSDEGQPLIAAGLRAWGLLTGPPELERVRLPVQLVADPAAWLVGVARAGAVDPVATGAALLDAITPLLPGRADATSPHSWVLVDPGVALSWSVVDGRLRLETQVNIIVDFDNATHEVGTVLTAGVLIGPGGPPVPVLELAVTVDGKGLSLEAAPTVTLSLVRTGIDPLRIYPGGPGLGAALGTAVRTAVPRLLDAVADLAGGPSGVRRDVGVLVREAGDSLGLRVSGHFDGEQIGRFAADPAAALLSHLPTLGGAAAEALANALDPSHALVKAVDHPAPGRTRFRFGAPAEGSLSLVLHTTGPPAVEVATTFDLPGVGVVALESLRLSAAGVAIAARVGPLPVRAGPVSVRPLLVVRAGSAVGAERLVSLGLALDDGAVRSVEMQWTLDGRAPTLSAVTRDGSGLVVSTQVEQGPAWLLSFAVSLTTGIVVEGLGAMVDGRVQEMLRGVLFTSGKVVDPAFAVDLLDPQRMFGRLERLLWNAATATRPLALTVGPLTIGLAHSATDTNPTDAQVGVRVGITRGQRFLLAEGSTNVELEADDTWLLPHVDGGLSIYVARGRRTGDELTFSLEPGVVVAGLGVRFSNPSGPLIELGPVAVDAIALHLYAEAHVDGLGGGAQVTLSGLAVAPSGAGGTNAVASSILSDAGAHTSPANRPAFSPAFSLQRHPGESGFRVSLRADPAPGPWWVLVQRQLGPLYVERVGLDTAEANGQITRIALLFDGRVEIFGLTAAVDQLSLTWLGDDVFDADRWAVDLMGLAVSADLSGVVLSGGLLKIVDPDPHDSNHEIVSYVGMLLGRFGIYGLSVFGGYTDDRGTPSFFVFGAFNGPIGGPPAFFVTGIGGGLGINRRLVIPDDPAQFPTYPFIQALDVAAPVPDPMQRLRELSEFFGPERGTFWFAGGISFTCFSLVDGIAVVAVSFGNGLEINLMGLARMALPRPGAALVSIELGLLARFSTREGLFMIRAALTDNSWLLYEDVRLTGGFAFCLWWKGPLAGQFVLTIGGYHPAFTKPEGYPDVPRVGLCWRVSDEIVIKGGSYFALTSEALMAGVSVEAVADFGWAWARARFSADGLVYFDPFWFDVEVRASISAGIHIDTFLGDIDISITTGCGVHVWGPDFSGVASVEVGPCTVDIPFGANARREGVVHVWASFVPKYLEEAGGGKARALTAITGRGTVPAATGGDRSAAPPDGSRERPFEVFAEFELTITTTVPITGYDLGRPTILPARITRSDGRAMSLGLKPMKAGALSSVLQVRLKKKDSAGSWPAVDADLGELTANIVASTPAADGSAVASGSFPLGVWGTPDADDAAHPALPAGDIVNAGNQIRLVAGATLHAPGPSILYRQVDAGRRPLPLRVTGQSRADLVGAGDQVTTSLPRPDTVADVLRAAGAVLFAPQPDPVADGPQPRGDRSGLARAAYAGDVSAPPLFGSLTDGLDVAGPPNTVSEKQVPRRAQKPPAVREPRVLGVLTGGALVAARSSGTTVSGRPVKRRVAPTLGSVQARLGRHLPVQISVATLPGAVVGRTFTPAAMPFTGAAGTARSYGLGVGPATTAVAGLSSLGGAVPTTKRAVASAGVTESVPLLASGDVVALHSPDHAADLDDERPNLLLGGSARVTFLRGDGQVLLDAVVTDRAEVPPGTELAAVQADGTIDVVDGLAGWHSRSRVAALGSSAAIGPGCVLGIEGASAGIGMTWTTAGALVNDAPAVLTRFSRPVTCVALVVEAEDPERVEDMGLELIGAARAVHADGSPVEASLVVNGTQTVAVYAVVPDPDAADGVAVRVLAGGGWRLTGVLGSAQPVDDVVQSLVLGGVAAAAGRLLATVGEGCRPAWVHSEPPSKRLAPKSHAKKRGGARRGR